MTSKISHAREFMKTTITIDVIKTEQHSTIEINDAIELAFGEFDRIVKKFTRFNQDSELSNLNRNGGTWTGVSEEFVMLIDKMLELSRATDGAFDPTVIDFLETYGYDPNYDFGKLDNPDLNNVVDKMAKTRPSWREIEVNAEKNEVKLATGQRIDLGGIGKGYAIDCAYRHLDKFESFLIDGGGDIRCKGTNDKGEPWQLNLLHKNKQAAKNVDATKDVQTSGRENKAIDGKIETDEHGKSDNENSAPDVIGQVKVSDMAIACSGSWARRVKQFHHILDPKTGAPVESMQTVYVSAPDATTADAWATALFVGGKELLEKLPAGAGAILIDANNKAIITETFPKFI